MNKVNINENVAAQSSKIASITTLISATFPLAITAITNTTTENSVTFTDGTSVIVPDAIFVSLTTGSPLADPTGFGLGIVLDDGTTINISPAAPVPISAPVVKIGLGDWYVVDANGKVFWMTDGQYQAALAPDSATATAA